MTELDIQKLTTEASQAFDKQQYAVAEQLQHKVVELLDAQSAHASEIADEIEKLAWIHLQQGKFGLAATEYERVLKSRELALPTHDERVLRVLYSIGKSHFHEMKYDLAESAFRRALSACDAQIDSTRQSAQFVSELGFLLYFVGRYREAEGYLLRALALYEELLGGNDPATVWVIERLALNYERCPEIGKDPEPYYRRAAQALSPDEHKGEYVANLCRWAECVAESKRFEEADKLYDRLLSLIDESAEWHTDWHWILSNCVEYFQSRGNGGLVAHLTAKEAQYDAYGEMTRQKLEHAERTLPNHDPELAEALFNAGNHALFQQNHSEAETLLKRALNSNIMAHGEESEAVVANLNRLCVVARELNKPDEAENMIQRALTIAKNSFPNSHVYPRSIETLALLREQSGKMEEATNLYGEAVAIFERQYGYPSYETLECLYRQSGHLLRAGRFTNAETAIRRVIGAMDEVKDVSDFEKSDYAATLASALEGLGRKNEADEAGKRAEDLLERARKNAEAE